MNLKKTGRWMLCAAALVVAACGGGGGGGADISGGGGIGGTGVTPQGGDVAFGTITAFGSVWVNGVEYTSSSAAVRIDDNPGAESDLRVGMVVRIDGSIASRNASTITVDDAIKGRVEQVLDANRMVVMGQTVQIDAQTRFDNNVVPVVGDLVNVYGLVAGDGVIAAGFIEKKTAPANPPFAVKGTVKNHDTVAQTFQIGTLNVRYAGATVSDQPAGSWNGLQVDVKGSTCAASPVCGTLTATKVEPAGAGVTTAARSEIEGIVSAGTANGFTVGNQAVVTTASTVYEGGVAADVIAGTKVEVEGAISGGVLTAVKVSFRDAVRIEGNVLSVNAAAGTLTIDGLPGVTVSVSSITELKNLSSLAALAAPNNLRIRGKLGTGNTLVATELELRDTRADSRVILQAAASAVSAPDSVTLLGVVVNTATVSNNNFQDVSGAVIGRAAFFSAARVGTLIKARGTLANGSVTWSEMELES